MFYRFVHTRIHTLPTLYAVSGMGTRDERNAHAPGSGKDVRDSLFTLRFGCISIHMS